MTNNGRRERHGLYDPFFEHDACGVGFVANIDGERSHGIIEKGLTVLENLTHRGACGCDELTGDGAGMLIQVPTSFCAKAVGRSRSTCRHRASTVLDWSSCRRIAASATFVSSSSSEL